MTPPTTRLITGQPGVGKTTFLATLIDRLHDLSPVGFLTHEIRLKGSRVGFEIVTLDGHRTVLAHVDITGPHRVGKYGVDTAALDRVLDRLDLPQAPGSLVVIDEIGKMECLSSRFRDTVRALVDAERLLLASIALKGAGFIAQVKAHPGTELMELTSANRASLAPAVESWIRSVPGPGTK